MVKKIGDKKLDKVKGTKDTESVKGSGSVSGVENVKGAGGVGGVGKVGAVGKRRATKVMTLAEREELFKMINEEAEKLFGGGDIPEAQKEVVKNAVKMAVEAGLLDKDESKDE